MHQRPSRSAQPLGVTCGITTVHRSTLATEVSVWYLRSGFKYFASPEVLWNQRRDNVTISLVLLSHRFIEFGGSILAAFSGWSFSFFLFFHGIWFPKPASGHGASKSLSFSFVCWLFGCGVSAWVDREKKKRRQVGSRSARVHGDDFWQFYHGICGSNFAFSLSGLNEGSEGFNRTHLNGLFWVYRGDTESVTLLLFLLYTFCRFCWAYHMANNP